MGRAIWILAWIAVALWSLFAWGAYALVDVFGDAAVRNADVVTGHPEAVEFLGWALATLRSLGLAAVVVVWGLVSLIVLGIGALLSRLFGRRPTHHVPEWQREVRIVPPAPEPPRPRAGGPPSAVKDVMRRIEDRR
jgi:hypothetical protein